MKTNTLIWLRHVKIMQDWDFKRTVCDSTTSYLVEIQWKSIGEKSLDECMERCMQEKHVRTWISRDFFCG